MEVGEIQGDLILEPVIRIPRVSTKIARLELTPQIRGQHAGEVVLQLAGPAMRLRHSDARAVLPHHEIGPVQIPCQGHRPHANAHPPARRHRAVRRERVEGPGGCRGTRGQKPKTKGQGREEKQNAMESH